ncbi:unnamed protein product [Eretmochelys imbricata]
MEFIHHRGTLVPDDNISVTPGKEDDVNENSTAEDATLGAQEESVEDHIPVPFLRGAFTQWLRAGE